MTTTITIKCSQCKRELNNDVFYYNGKPHKTCFACSKRRKTRKNACSECGIGANFNYEGETIGIRCKLHSLPDMVDIKSKKCITCKKKRANFNFSTETKATHCGDCALPDMINITSKKCIVCKKKIPTFNLENETKATHCKNCALTDMVDIKHTKCVTCKKKRASFNVFTETKATHCGNCALTDMIDIKNKKCIVCKKKIPNFNLPGETRGTHCRDCALTDMINVRSKKCIVCKKKIPNFNLPGETRGTHCKDCALTDMINVRSKKCIVCKKKIPNFNLPGEIKGTHCGKCAIHGMTDLKNKKCLVCNKYANYGIPCNQPTACVTHKTEGMIFKPRAKCRKKDCKQTAIHGIKTPIHCELHKNDNDINLVERKCERCGKLDILVNGICLNFCVVEEKYTDYKKHQKVKEKRILQILKSHFGAPTEYNLKIPRDCGGKNSEEKEIGYDCVTHIIYIEVDERQHKSYCELGEINRMKNIYMSSGGIPMIFVRYNPDNFLSVNGKKQKLSQAKREELLIKWIKFYKENPPIYDLAVKYLFYDGHTDGRDKYYEIDPYDTRTYSCDVCDEEFYVKGVFEEHKHQIEN